MRKEDTQYCFSQLKVLAIKARSYSNLPDDPGGPALGTASRIDH